MAQAVDTVDFFITDRHRLVRISFNADRRGIYLKLFRLEFARISEIPRIRKLYRSA